MNVRRNGDGLWLWCPACDDAHRIVVDGPTAWQWDGNEDAPTVTPSIKVTGVQWAEGEAFHKPQHLVPAGQPVICHSFLTGGVWNFLNDCTHAMAGKAIPVVPIPDWLDR